MRQSVPRLLRPSGICARCLPLSSRSSQFVLYNAGKQSCRPSLTLPSFGSPSRQYALYSRSYTSGKSSRLPNLFVFGVVFGLALYMLFPRHTFSKDVAKKLREGLRAESRIGNFNHKKGLECYIEALSIAFSEGLSPLSDEVTGIMVKIAGTYQALEEYDKACSVAGQIITIYEAALMGQKAIMVSKGGASRLQKTSLSDNPRLASIQFEEDPKVRSHYLQRCLLMYAFIATIQSELGNNTFAGQVVVSGLYLARNEIALRIQMKRQKSLSMEDELKSVSQTSSQQQNVDVAAELETDKNLLGTFGREFFALRGLLASISLEMQHFMDAAEISHVNSRLMKAVDYSIGDILYSRYVAASAHVMEADRLRLDVNEKEASTTTTRQEELYNEAEQEFEDILLEGSKIPEWRLAVNRSNIEAAAKLDEKASQDPMALSNYYVEQSIEYTLAWTRHGLGVVYLGKGQYSAAERLFRETLEWAKKNKDDLMRQCCETELDNCKKEKNAAASI